MDQAGATRLTVADPSADWIDDVDAVWRLPLTSP
jgi:hypothetical protein